VVHSSVNIRKFAAHDVEPVLALNNANVPELNELDAAEVARLADLA
jgi:predicted GNAT superfamily acetyltransferase